MNHKIVWEERRPRSELLPKHAIKDPELRTVTQNSPGILADRTNAKLEGPATVTLAQPAMRPDRPSRSKLALRMLATGAKRATSVSFVRRFAQQSRSSKRIDSGWPCLDESDGHVANGGVIVEGMVLPAHTGPGSTLIVIGEPAMCTPAIVIATCMLYTRCTCSYAKNVNHRIKTNETSLRYFDPINMVDRDSRSDFTDVSPKKNHRVRQATLSRLTARAEWQYLYNRKLTEMVIWTSGWQALAKPT